MIAGFLFFPAKGCGISVSLNPELFRVFDHVPGEISINISGAPVRLGPLMRRLEFRIERRNHALLAFVIISSMALSTWLWPSRNSGLNDLVNERLAPGQVMYYFASLWLVVVSLAYKWLADRRLLARSALALATAREVHEVGRLLRGRLISYSFIDRGGERFGALVRQYSRCHSNLELIFYNVDDPNRSCHASGLLFYKVVLADTGAHAARESVS